MAQSLQLCDSSNPELASRVTAGNQVLLQLYLQNKNTRHLITTSVVVTTVPWDKHDVVLGDETTFGQKSNIEDGRGDTLYIGRSICEFVLKIWSKCGSTLTSLCDGYSWESEHRLRVEGGVKRKDWKRQRSSKCAFKRAISSYLLSIWKAKTFLRIKIPKITVQFYHYI